MTHLKELSYKLQGLVLFRNLLQDKGIAALIRLLEAEEKNTKEQINGYAEWTHILFSRTENLTEYIWSLIESDVNIYVQKKVRDEMISKVISDSLEKELETLQGLSRLKASDVCKHIDFDGFLPLWTESQIDFHKAYENHMANIHRTGFGIFHKQKMFTYIENHIEPVRYPDPIRLFHLTGYESARNQVIHNTQAFLAGKPAANVLLYGDAGTGKSSTVKAIVNEYGDQGLRLVEISKGRLLQLPALIEELSQNPLRFIIFIDDLSFTQSSEEVGVLKAIIEGSASAKPENVVIYATSNRRHLIKESFSERAGDDVHREETIQEQVSLSERFGLTVLFAKPNKKDYLHIVSSLAKQLDVADTENIEGLAEAYALKRGGRSGRTARQFIEALKRGEI